MTDSQAFIRHIQAARALLNKILFLYADTEEDRKDLRQEILTQAWSAYPRFREESRFDTWLYRIGINVAITSLRKKQKRPQPPPAANAIRAVVPGEERELLRQILGVLDPVEKSIILALIEGYQPVEIGELLGITAGNARVKIHRIRQKLNEHGIEQIAS